MRNQLSLLLFLSLLPFLFMKVRPQQQLAPALYAFGDSLADDGNNNFLVSLSRSNYAPYGVDFPNGPTGRFTNGYTSTDIIAQLLGLPLPPPYLSITSAKISKVVTGANYASGSAGILDESGKTFGERLPFNKQLDLFQKTVQQQLPSQFNSSQALQQHISKSIFMVQIGSNDYLNNYLLPEYYPTSRDYTPPAFANLLTQNLSQQLTGTNGTCSDRVNNIVALFNDQLPPLLTTLTSTLNGSIFVYGNLFGPMSNMTSNPSTFGMLVTNKPCCVADVSGSTLCRPLLPPCRNREQYLFWDGVHPTPILNALFANACFNQSTTLCSPLNIQQLTRA
ncbi:hypothetical protein AMTRI_Chr10g231870 [Amborella trichopoda]